MYLLTIFIFFIYDPSGHVLSFFLWLLYFTYLYELSSMLKTLEQTIYRPQVSVSKSAHCGFFLCFCVYKGEVKKVGAQRSYHDVAFRNMGS